MAFWQVNINYPVKAENSNTYYQRYCLVYSRRPGKRLLQRITQEYSAHADPQHPVILETQSLG